MNKEELKTCLLNKVKCPESQLEPLFAKFEKWNEDLKQALYLWLTDDTIPDITENDYSVSRLMEEKGMKVIAALMTIDWLRREPDAALNVLKHGVDRIVPSKK